MPYRSEAQRRKFHAMLERGEIDPDTVHEYDEASKGMDLPERVGPRKKRAKMDGKRVHKFMSKVFGRGL